jgi:hypothetical protein
VKAKRIAVYPVKGVENLPRKTAKRLPFVLKETDGSTVATGQDFLRLAADGRAELMYAFFDQ